MHFARELQAYFVHIFPEFCCFDLQMNLRVNFLTNPSLDTFQPLHIRHPMPGRARGNTGTRHERIHDCIHGPIAGHIRQ